MQPFLHVQIDDAELRRWADELSNDAMRKAVRNAVDKAGRETFKEAAVLIETETGVARAKWGKAIGRMQRPTQFDLSARVTYSRKKVSILNVKGARIEKGKGLTVTGWALSANGALRIDRAFAVGAKSQSGSATGKSFVLMRVGAGRYPLTAIVAATPSAVMQSRNGVVVKQWRDKARSTLSKHLNADVQKALLGQATRA